MSAYQCSAMARDSKCKNPLLQRDVSEVQKLGMSPQEIELEKLILLRQTLRSSLETSHHYRNTNMTLQ